MMQHQTELALAKGGRPGLTDRQMQTTDTALSLNGAGEAEWIDW